MSKKIIINADDFGLTRAVNYGILDGFLNKSISSTSLMVNALATDHAVELIKKYDLKGIGIHVNITLGKPISKPEEVVTLLNDDGSFKGNKYYIEGNHVNEDELIKEFDNQIQRFIELVGREPDHINYHHIYDFYRVYPKLFKFLIDKYNKPMRLEKDYDIYNYQYATKSDLFMNFKDINIEEELKADLIEVPCHIGFVDQSLMKISSLNIDRTKDSELANSDEFKKMYTGLGYELVGWNNIEKK